MKKKIKFLIATPLLMVPFFSFVSCSNQTKESKELKQTDLENLINFQELEKNFTKNGTNYWYDENSINNFLIGFPKVDKDGKNTEWIKYKISNTQSLGSNPFLVVSPELESIISGIYVKKIENNSQNNFLNFSLNINFNNEFNINYSGTKNMWIGNNNIFVNAQNYKRSITFGIGIRIGEINNEETKLIKDSILIQSNFSYNFNAKPKISATDFINPTNVEENFKKYIIQKIPLEKDGWKVDFLTSKFSVYDGKNKGVEMNIVLKSSLNPNQTISNNKIIIFGFDNPK